jgi:ubiquinone/menaquinone biosynthesis C-methylase UbiE
MKNLEKRKLEEIEFHNIRERDRKNLTHEEFESKYSNKKIYRISDISFDYLTKLIGKNAKGKVCLDYCCGLGDTSVNLYKHGASKVYGIDIADNELKTAKEKVEKEGFDSSGFVVGDAEDTPFDDNTFDLIVCIGVLHHLDTNKAFPELYRILKPGGKVIAFEALAYNPIIQLYRNLTPHLRTDWEKDHILSMKDLRLARKFFKNKAEVKFFHLATLLSIPFTSFFFFKPLIKILNFIDYIILRIPLLRLMAWQMIFTLKK